MTFSLNPVIARFQRTTQRSPTFSFITVVISIFLLTRSGLACAHETKSSYNIVSKTRQVIESTRSNCLSHSHLTCQFSPTSKNSVIGRVHFQPVFRTYRGNSRTRCLVRIRAVVRNLSPGLHGFHIHQFGDIRSNDGSSTGGHFSNPTGRDIPHGFPNSRRRHWGDFGSLNAGSDGIAIYNRVDRVIRLGGIVGRGMVIHALEDLGPDAQPSGGAGSRQAHCVIGYANMALPVRDN